MPLVTGSDVPPKPKHRQSLAEVLASCSDTLFPDGLGQTEVTVHSRDADGDTALHVLLWRGNDHGVRLLIDAGADVNAVGDMGETPLHIAIRQGNVAAVETLLRAGAKTGYRSEFGQTPHDMAVGSAAIKRLLDQHRD